jgi:hypothetical protein
MAHYAFLDENNIVTEVIPGRNEDEVIDGITDWEVAYGEIRGQKCVRTSYNGNIRYNYAGIGYSYDPIDDAFIPPVPCEHEELILNNLKRWECSSCDDDIKQRMASIEE